MKIFIYIKIINYKVDINLMGIKMTDRKNYEDISDGVCEVFDSHEDVIERVQKRMIDEEQYSELSEFFKIFGNPTRLKILSLLTIEDLCVCDICEALNLNQTTVSNQLRILRAHNIVKYQKEGKMARYSLTDLHIEMIYKVGLEHILE
ncbi:DNA-binding transcriptional regulator, ArsR family [Methanobrevibacter millerae]|uniref:DNA-binding transcriptional regulator, ArsR family n=2 Tax=Methanobrevibacter millerae TaxID=230361 RepID=A0A1G5UX11_9EURY|nr:DNA-binding transcriptional regulator, ArsR family [Methanobrevibacter millerae]